MEAGAPSGAADPVDDCNIHVQLRIHLHQGDGLPPPRLAAVHDEDAKLGTADQEVLDEQRVPEREPEPRVAGEWGTGKAGPRVTPTGTSNSSATAKYGSR